MQVDDGWLGAGDGGYDGSYRGDSRRMRGLDGDDAVGRRSFVLEEQNGGDGKQGECSARRCSTPPSDGEGGAGETVMPAKGGPRKGGCRFGGKSRCDASGYTILQAFGGSDSVEGGQGFVDRVVGLAGFGFHKVSLSIFEALAEVGAGAEEQRADAGFAAVEDGGDLGGGEFFHGRKQQGLAFFAGQALHGAEHLLDLCRVGERPVGRQIGGDQGGGEEIVHLGGPGAAGAVEGEVPGDADQPGAEVEDGTEQVPALEDADEGVLNDVLGFGRVAEDGERDR